MLLFYLFFAFLLGAAFCYLVLRERLRAQAEQLRQLDAVRGENTRLHLSLGEEKGRVEALEGARTGFADAFQSASAEAVRRGNEQFLTLAEQRFERLRSDAAGDLGIRQQAVEQLVKPLRETLEKVEMQVRKVEEDRIGAYSVLTAQVRSLETEARKLATALASPAARGRWGEVQLRRVVEIAGMVEYCDFAEQMGIAGADTRLRPDLVIQLPNAKRIVVDSKVPLTAYLAACELADETARKEKLEEHARQIRNHLKLLGSKAYSAQLSSSPEFVVAFLPGEIFFSAALQVDSELIEFGVRNNVILATPTTLIALLKAVAYGWKQEQVAENAREIQKLGAQLYERVKVFSEHYESVGKALHTALGAYNKGRVSMETRLLSTVRKFEEYGVAPTGIGALPQPLPFAGEPALDFGIDAEDGGTEKVPRSA